MRVVSPSSSRLTPRALVTRSPAGSKRPRSSGDGDDVEGKEEEGEGANWGGCNREA